jgi:hypothetical protein
MTIASNSSIQVQDLRCEYEHNPPGIDVRAPRLSWKLVSEQRGVVQSAYQIQVTNEQGEVVWETGEGSLRPIGPCALSWTSAPIQTALHLAGARLGWAGSVVGLE